MSTELSRIEEPGQLQAPAPVNVGQIIGEIMKKGIDPSAAASAIKELVQLQNQQEERWARRQFLEAFKRVRDKTKTIQCEKPVPGANGTVRWWYAPIEDLQDAIEPLCESEGLMLNFDSPRVGDIVRGICIVFHAASGHEERRECSVDVKKAEGGDLGAAKKAKRGALTAMFGLKTRHMDENDPRMLGDLIAPEDAEELQRRCAALGAEYTRRLLKYLRTDDFSGVYSSRLEDARRSLDKVEKAKTNPSPGTPAVAPRTVGVASDSPSPGGAAAPSNAPSGFNNPGESGAVEPPAGRTFPSDFPQTTEATHDGAPRQSGRAQGSEAHAVAPVQTTPPAQTGRAGGDQWEHWRTMNASDTLSTYAAMSRDKQIQLFKNLPADVKALVKSNIEKARAERTAS